MKKKLFALTAVLGIAAFAASVPSAEAIGYCSTTYCAGKSPDTPCACPKGTDRAGQPTFCGASGSNWSNCWYV